MSPHRKVLTDFVRKHQWTRGAELGVDKGILFRSLLEGNPQLHLTGVDVFPLPERKHRVYQIALSFADRCRLVCDTTHRAADEFADGSFDFVFIDADHSYDAAKDDIARWRPKVRKGGWLGGHDYSKHFPGVIQAVDERFGSAVHTLMPGWIWGVWC